jgi:bacteriocin biosynthesis cyclodehydratase domain-containing protein
MPTASQSPPPPIKPTVRTLPGLPAGAGYMVSPAVRVAWRAPDAVQLELGGRAVIVDGVDSDAVLALTAPHRSTGTRGRPAPLPPDAFDADSLSALAEGGWLWPAAGAEDERTTPPVPRMAPDLLAVTAWAGTGAARLLAARRKRTVAVEGLGRGAVQLAALLAAAGVGRVSVPSAADVRLHSVQPGGLLPEDEGRRFAAAASDAVRRAAPDVDTRPLAIGECPDLVVLAVDQPVDQDRVAALQAAGCSHLVVQVGPGSGTVGPLVVPGRTSCLGCADLHRRDRDSAWHAIAVQLTVPPPRGQGADVVTTALVVAVAAGQVLALLDGTTPAAVDGTLEVEPPDWRVRRRSRTPHPRCDCGAGR